MGELGDLGRWVGEVGEYVSTCQVSQGVMAKGKWKMRKRQWRLGARGTVGEQNQTLALTELRPTHRLSSVSGLVRGWEGVREGGKKRQEEMDTDKHLERVTEKGSV